MSRRRVDIVGGISYDQYEITKAEEFTAASGLFEFPKGGSDSFNWQSGRSSGATAARREVHASVSDRSRFPVLFELYSTRFGTATPNPDLGPERATNLEVGWKGRAADNVRLEGAVFYSDVRDLDSDRRPARHHDADAERRRRQLLRSGSRDRRAGRRRS